MKRREQKGPRGHLTLSLQSTRKVKNLSKGREEVEKTEMESQIAFKKADSPSRKFDLTLDCLYVNK